MQATFTSQDSFAQTCKRLGLPGDDITHHQLIKAWSQWHRRYHTLEHLQACLRWQSTVAQFCQEPDEVAIALWFHDAIYKTTSKTNEADSAAWAKRWLQQLGAEHASVQRVQQLILATQHGAVEAKSNEEHPDIDWMLDIDLSILGAHSTMYAKFEKLVRAEYWWVLPAAFKRGRAHILRSFLESPHIYRTQFFRDRLEAQARTNLHWAIARLTGTSANCPPA